MSAVFEKFWSRHPALLYGLMALFGFYLALYWKVEILIPLLALWLPLAFGSKKYRVRAFLSIGIFGAMFFYGWVAYQLPVLSDEGVPGTLHFEISSVAHSQTNFGYQWIYQGKGKVFIPDDSQDRVAFGKNFLCSVRLSKKGLIQRPSADQSYVIQGLLKSTARGGYYFVGAKEAPWLSVEGSWNLAEWRYGAKSTLKNYVFRQIKNRRSAEFLSGIITGDFEDKIMRLEFGKTGLQHIMAISGFHFALIAMILGMALRWISTPGAATWILITLLSGYFAVLGGSPSVLRAWVMCLVALSGFIAEKPSYALNSLGIGLLVILFYDPLLSLTLGFQFSMSTTSSILLWYPLAKIGLDKVLPTRHLGQMSEMTLIDQHNYCLLSTVKEGIALAIAVNLTALPMTLHLFGKFPFLSLLYNLFIPFLVSISVFLFLLSSVVTCLLPPLGAVLHGINGSFTHFMLDFIYNVPNTLQYNWQASDFSAPYLAGYLCTLFLAGISLNARQEESRFAFAFL